MKNELHNDHEELRQCLIRLTVGLSNLSPTLAASEKRDCDEMVSSFRRSLIPQLGKDFPILVAVTGGGSSGKSTVFNTLVGTKASGSNPRAGYTRCIVAAVNPHVASDESKMNLLFERFRANARPRKLERADQMLEAGDPVYVECPSVPDRLVFIDTPDFDTGTVEGFTNRDAATEILDVSDVVLYIVTNQTYNNKSASDYIRSILSKIGVRKVALLYRCSPAFEEDDVREHMRVALSNLYPDKRTANDACIGVWRIDESNDVAAGRADPVFHPLADGIPLEEALSALDPTMTRAEGMRTAIADGLQRTEGWISIAETESRQFAAYRDALRFLTSAACKQCLEITPQRDILQIFGEEWKAAQPWLVRNGHYLSRGAMKAIGTVRGWLGKKQTEEHSPGFAEVFRKTFLDKARDLQKDVESPSVSFDFSKTASDLTDLVENLRRLSAETPSSYSLADLDPKQKDGRFSARIARPTLSVSGKEECESAGEQLSRMADRAASVMGETESIRPEIRQLVKMIRAEMSAWQSAKEWFSASLDTVALVGALTYVATTGDAFTGGELVSMFGFNDLVAVPALGTFIATHSKIDKETAKRQLSRLFTTWAANKTPEINGILEEGITGALIDECDRRCKEIGGNLERMKADLAEARDMASRVFETDEGQGA